VLLESTLTRGLKRGNTRLRVAPELKGLVEVVKSTTYSPDARMWSMMVSAHRNQNIVVDYPDVNLSVKKGTHNLL